MEITVSGLVIKEKAFKGDRILLILTNDHGVVTAYAKGAKSPKSRFASSTELFCYSRFVLTEKKDNYWVENADVIDVFFGLRSSIEKISLASYFCEIASVLSPIDNNSHEYLRLILNCLKFLEKNKKSYFFLKSVYELRLLTMSGFMPDLVGCLQCGCFQNPNMYFFIDSGVIICQKCFENSGNTEKFVNIPPSVLSAMRHIIYSPFDKLFSFSLSEKSLEILKDTSEKYLLTHIDFTPKTLLFLHTIM